ncbi:Fc.00g059840.m01.CDS01 [Cosmosporella sp. VM-42]
MAFTLYDATIVEAKIALTTINHILNEAEKQPNSHSFPKARLYEDMKPLTFQVHSATRFSELVLARLSGRDAVEYEDDLVSFADMHARIAKVLEALGQADKDSVNQHGEEVAPTHLPSAGTMDIPGKAFAMGAAIPNINFHLSMTYAILRKEGVPLGKKDYIMGFATEHILKLQR